MTEQEKIKGLLDSIPTLVQDIPQNMVDENGIDKGGWTIVNKKRDGTYETIESSHLIIINPKFARFDYGKTAAGFNGVTSHQPMGGGAVIIPFIDAVRSLYIGVLEQSRPNQQGWVYNPNDNAYVRKDNANPHNVLNAPRGFAKIGEKKSETAKREGAEETGFIGLEKRIFPLSDTPTNCDSAFYETPSDDEGVLYYGLQIRPDEVEPALGDTKRYQFRSGVWQHQLSQTEEKISKCVFIPWSEVAKLKDGYTKIGTLLVLQHIQSYDALEEATDWKPGDTHDYRRIKI